MKHVLLILCIALSLFTSILNAQTDTIHSCKLKITTGAGYFNDEGILNGNVFFSEIGIKLKSGYSMSVQGYMAEALNNKRLAEDFTYEFLYTYKIANLLFGYEFISKSGKHSLEPMAGPFISENRIVFPSIQNYTNVIKEKKYIDLGFAVALKYQFNINYNISLGVQGTANIAYNYGYLYGTIMPVFSIRY